MKERGSVVIFALIVVIVVGTIAGGFFYAKNVPKNLPIKPEVTPSQSPKSSPIQISPSAGQQPYTSKIEKFVKDADFSQGQEVSIFIDLPEKSLKVFRISYGPPQDCPAGCFYSNATGIEYKDKIGWISINNYSHTDTSKLVMYDFDSSDAYLFSDEFFQLLKSKDEWVYQNAFLPKLAEDKDVPSEILLKITNGLSSYIQPSLANSLLKNPTVVKDREILTIIANLPVFSGDAYSEVRAKAQNLLK